jgi:hypothetical protein
VPDSNDRRPSPASTLEPQSRREARRPREREEDDLARRIREMLEGKKSPKPEARSAAPARPVAPVAPVAPVQAPVARAADQEMGALQDSYDSSASSFDQGSSFASDAEFAANDAAFASADFVSTDFSSGMFDVGSLGAELESTGMGSVDSKASARVSAGVAGTGLGRAPLPEGVQPRSAFELMVALGPCRAQRSFDEEQQRFH